jgi:hypothetical protein
MESAPRYRLGRPRQLSDAGERSFCKKMADGGGEEYDDDQRGTKVFTKILSQGGQGILADVVAGIKDQHVEAEKGREERDCEDARIEYRQPERYRVTVVKQFP